MSSKKANFQTGHYFKNRTKRVHRKKMSFTTPLKPVIPLHIYQTWHDKQSIPLTVQNSIDKIKEQNPEFEHHLYDEKECRHFIKDHFPKKVVDSYDSVVHKAIKCDLWKYCMMYQKGGIYLDSKYYGIDGFKFIYLTDKEYYCADFNEKIGAVYNAIFICKPKNPQMLRAIYQCVKNTEEKYYGSHELCVGPLMLSHFFRSFELKHIIVNKRKKYIVYKGHPILKYDEKYSKIPSQKKNHWIHIWKEKKLYV
jgi:hypothetical protein